MPLRPDGHLPHGEEWKERYVGEDEADMGKWILGMVRMR